MTAVTHRFSVIKVSFFDFIILRIHLGGVTVLQKSKTDSSVHLWSMNESLDID